MTLDELRLIKMAILGMLDDEQKEQAIFIINREIKLKGDPRK